LPRSWLRRNRLRHLVNTRGQQLRRGQRRARVGRAGPAAGDVYVGGYSTVSVISPATNTVTATIPVGSAPDEVAISPTTGDVYVTNVLGGTVSVINPTTNQIIDTITLNGDQGFPAWVAAAGSTGPNAGRRGPASAPRGAAPSPHPSGRRGRCAGRRLGHPVGVSRRQVGEDVPVGQDRGQGFERGGVCGARRCRAARAARR
jgi:YVTN family beta-propeller protein